MHLKNRNFGGYAPSFGFITDIVGSVCEALRPVERLTVSEAAAKYRKLNNPGSYVGPWRNEKTPYLVEPMDTLNSDEHDSMILVGPSQVGKTDIFLNWLLYTIRCDPTDIAIVQTSEKTGREFRHDKIAKFLRHTPEAGERVAPGRNNLNTFDVRFKSGMRFMIWGPTVNDLSGKTLPRLLLTDYDRMPDNIDGEGDAFTLGKRRTTVYKMHGMTAAESSPGRDITDPKWQVTADRPHEAPPSTGILSLYNKGDRRRRYWRCPHCHDVFEPDFKHLYWPDSHDHQECADGVKMVCPHCGCFITQDMRSELDFGGKWLKEGQLWLPDGSVQGTGLISKTASFWIKGVLGFATSWSDMVKEYLDAKKLYDDTGDVQALKTTINTKQGLPFIPPSIASARLPEDVKTRAYGGAARMIPEGVRFLVACIDIQKRRFVVQVHGVGERADIWVIDRFDIKDSLRTDEQGRPMLVDPASNLEDWFLLVEQVLKKTYPLADGSGRQMAIKLTVSDSGGAKAASDDGSEVNGGVTEKAYAFWRWLRDEQGDGFHKRFQLVKGGSNRNAARVEIRYPDSERKDRKAGARGEIPVMLINTTMVKDALDAMLNRREARGGLISIPDWLPDRWFKELTSETRTPKGWKKTSGAANEAWDLLAYCIAAIWSALIRIEDIDWNKPPTWADEWDVNDFVFEPDREIPFTEHTVSLSDLSALADGLL